MKKFIVPYPPKFMVEVIEQHPDLIICWREDDCWYCVESPSPLFKSRIHEFIMLELHESYPVGDRWLLIPGGENLIEPFTSESWDEVLVWVAGRMQLKSDRRFLTKCLQLEIK